MPVTRGGVASFVSRQPGPSLESRDHQAHEESGMETPERFVRGEPRTRVRECVFGVLALESEPVDPRL